jgi:hypothetical protein
VYPWFKASTSKGDRAIHFIILSLRNRTQSDIGIMAEFQTGKQYIEGICINILIYRMKQSVVLKCLRMSDNQLIPYRSIAGCERDM